MKEVLFICQGNVGRSQMAEGFYNHHRGEIQAISAGTDDVGEKYNFIPRPDIIEAMQEKGIDISSQRIKQITESMLIEVETVIVLCNADSLPAFITSSALTIQFQEVPDPFESSMDGVRQIRDTIETIDLDILQKSD